MSIKKNRARWEWKRDNLQVISRSLACSREREKEREKCDINFAKLFQVGFSIELYNLYRWEMDESIKMDWISYFGSLNMSSRREMCWCRNASSVGSEGWLAIRAVTYVALSQSALGGFRLNLRSTYLHRNVIFWSYHFQPLRPRAVCENRGFLTRDTSPCPNQPPYCHGLHSFPRWRQTSCPPLRLRPLRTGGFASQARAPALADSKSSLPPPPPPPPPPVRRPPRPPPPPTVHVESGIEPSTHTYTWPWLAFSILLFHLLFTFYFFYKKRKYKNELHFRPPPLALPISLIYLF